MSGCQVSKSHYQYFGQVEDTLDPALALLVYGLVGPVFNLLPIFSADERRLAGAVYHEHLQLPLEPRLHELQLIMEHDCDHCVKTVVHSQGALLKVMSIFIGMYSVGSFRTRRLVVYWMLVKS